MGLVSFGFLLSLLSFLTFSSYTLFSHGAYSLSVLLGQKCAPLQPTYWHRNGSIPFPLVLAKLSTGLLTPCIEFGWNYNDIFKYITFKLRTEFVFWFAEKKNVVENRDVGFLFMLPATGSHRLCELRQDCLVSPPPSTLAWASPVMEQCFQLLLARQCIPVVDNSISIEVPLYFVKTPL